MLAQVNRHASQTDILFPVPIGIDNKFKVYLFEPAVPLDPQRALSLSSETGIHFAFPETETVYFMPVENTPFLLKGTAFLEITFITSAAVRGCSVCCFFYAENGHVLQEKCVTFSQNQTQQDISVPHGAYSMHLALCLKGSGFLKRPVIRLRRRTKRKSVPPADDRASGHVGKILSHALARNYYKGIHHFYSLKTPDDAARKQLIRCHAGLHDFETVVSEYKKLGSAKKADTGMKITYVRALANLGHIDAACDVIAQACANYKGTPRELDFLYYIYPFATHISDRLANDVLALVLSGQEHWPKKGFNHFLRCAHELSSQERFDESFSAMDRLRIMDDLSDTDMAKLDILQAHHAYVKNDPCTMLAHINTALQRYGAYTLSMPDDKPLDFAQVFCPHNSPGSVGGPLVSVLMTSYNSAGTIEYALRSLMQQTYSDLEIIVIDDNSRDDSCRRIRALAQEDPRIKLIALTENGGTYVAKNHGLACARGTFVTCQDSDDWAHPEKIETMVECLQENPELIATSIQHIRYDPDRGLRGLGGYIRADFSSLMYRREAITERIGYYDSVRVGADSEFQFRIERVFGKNCIRHLPHLLSLVLWSEKSLSGGGQFAIDDDAGIFSPFRNVYRTAFFGWQEHTDTLYVPFPLEKRPFDVPAEGLP